MTAIKTRVSIAHDHSISGRAPDVLTAGEYDAVITLSDPMALKFFRSADLPSHDLPWDDRTSLRREDL